MNRWTELAMIQRENGVWWCEVIGSDGKKDSRCTNRHDEGHHGVFEGQRSEKRREWRRFLDHAFNYCAACHGCNVNRIGDPDEARFQYFCKQIERYGKSAAQVWLMMAPLEIQERHQWQRMWTHVSGLE